MDTLYYSDLGTHLHVGSSLCRGGVILYDETINQTSSSGKKIPELISEAGAVPGIKVDTGAKILAGSPDEKITEGLDGLRERLVEYFQLGARFAKWRAVITIGGEIPSSSCIHANAHALARYAALCQEAGLVPIVEPEVLMDGKHTIETCYDVSKRTFHHVFEELNNQDVYLEGIVLKPNMVVSGIDCKNQASIEEVSQRTVDCLKETVPDSVQFVLFYGKVT